MGASNILVVLPVHWLFVRWGEAVGGKQNVCGMLFREFYVASYEMD